ncbi:MAG: excinuclease ABC subunit UvrC [Alphaproteobacteria bacterium]|nr:excinuclease ABC subunit UvrC [Alphaproteobacteria bacterium]
MTTPNADEHPRDAKSDKGVELIKARLKHLPHAPGVYRMLGGDGEVLYVGKARDLRNRVSNYAKEAGHSHRIARMIMETADLVVVTTGSNAEALLLEANLIKRLKPRYNVSYRDDKSFPNILLKAGHPYPQVQKHRGAKSQAGDYFGPFASAGAVNRTLNTLQRAFLLRSCSDAVFAARTRPCLLYQIKRCSAPCVGRIDESGYTSLVEDARAFLRRRTSTVRDHLKSAMLDAAARQEFETAASLRDRLRAISVIESNQGVNPETFEEADVFAIHEEGGQSCVQVFFFRGGQNWGNRAYMPRHDRAETPADVLDAFIAQFYDDKDPPRLILISEDIPDRDLLEEALTTRAGRKVEVLHPQRGEKREIIERARTNAREELLRRISESASHARLLEGVAEAFGLDGPPARIEVYDNSHIGGTHAVGGMIVAGKEGFLKKEYRKFNIKNKEAAPGDDYAMLREVLTRRFSRLLNDETAMRSSEGEDRGWPDLVLIDGGPGQLKVAEEVFADLGVEDVALVAIAKGPERDAGREHFHQPGREPFRMELKCPVLYYLQRLRDEAHRFAIGSHRAKRAKSIGVNPLDEVPGIGAARKRALLHHFGSARAVANANLADLEAVEGISKAMARKIYDYFHAAA